MATRKKRLKADWVQDFPHLFPGAIKPPDNQETLRLQLEMARGQIDLALNTLSKIQRKP